MAAKGLVANTYLEGTYSEVYPHIGRDEEGLRRLFRQFSFPGGIPSHVALETPGSIHEGGELGYALVHAYGAAFDNPDLLVCCVVGDGEAETGALATSWHSNKFLNPVSDGAVLPILHLNGYKIANPTVLARIGRDELRSLMEGYGYARRFVEGSEPSEMHRLMASTMEDVVGEIGEIQHAAREDGTTERPHWSMIVLVTPKGWTGPKEVDGLPAEGSFRSHQVPLAELAQKPSTSPSSSPGCTATGPTSSSTRTAGCSPSSPSWPRWASGAWAPTLTPTPAGCCGISSCPTSAPGPLPGPCMA
jgi:xylulose-5-phosphate/fructose-6-phosphate phosphoketolase